MNTCFNIQIALNLITKLKIAKQDKNRIYFFNSDFILKFDEIMKDANSMKDFNHFMFSIFIKRLYHFADCMNFIINSI